MSIFYTSEQHFCHENILKLCNRPFDFLAEMEEVLVQNCNGKGRGDDDTVYILGDLLYGGKYSQNAPFNSVTTLRIFQRILSILDYFL